MIHSYYLGVSISQSNHFIIEFTVCKILKGSNSILMCNHFVTESVTNQSAFIEQTNIQCMKHGT